MGTSHVQDLAQGLVSPQGPQEARQSRRSWGSS